MNLAEMRACLDREDIQLTRSLGQNFLHDGNQLRKIVEAAELAPDTQVLEIGPGLGPLTAGILGAGARVLAIEKDARLMPLLKQRFATETRLELKHADALDWLKNEAPMLDGWKVVSNLPYSVGSPILVELAFLRKPPVQVATTLQWEVIQRIRAKPGDEDYGILTLLLAVRYVARGAFRIPANCFFPAPDVESGCINLDLRPEPLVPLEALDAWAQLIKLAFSQRRKKMSKLLKSRWTEAKLEAAFGKAGLAPDIRAERVSADQFRILLNSLTVGD